ncbi:hypothetical protein [uncultured Jannaschia sp.]|uniref:hypothetical protein n=1 Tax=uncultured Jannaschia sp. TaxID=293347 RepID=UPI0026142043|nr:hypothetical protein [uncultured Jannaschia sp.]
MPPFATRQISHENATYFCIAFVDAMAGLPALAIVRRWRRLAPLVIPIIGLDVMFLAAKSGKFASGGRLPTILALAARPARAA